MNAKILWFWLFLHLKPLVMKRFGTLILLFLGMISGLSAQDTITVMQYNLLEYGNYNSSFANCYESNNNTQEKDECIRTILDYVRPDILTVNEFGATAALRDNFLRHNLNLNGLTNWKSDDIVNYANSNIINHIFYNSDKMELRRHRVVRTAVRDIDAYELYFKTAALAAHDTIRLVCVVAHLKAGSGTDNESKRRAMLQNAMYFIEENYPNDNVLIMGDFNMYSSSETGYRLLTQTYSNPDILFVDPLSLEGGVGYWDNNRDFAPFHTQSTTRLNNNPCRSSGGMDSRFDIMMMSDEVYMGFNSVRYVNHSYRAIGNDGNHFNMSINEGVNTAVPTAVADALFKNSDHLPITMKLAVYAKLGVDEHSTSDLLAYLTPNPASGPVTLHFYNPSVGSVRLELFTLQGQHLLTHEQSFPEGSHQLDLPLPNLRPGLYLLRLTAPNGSNQVLKLGTE